MRTNLIFGAPFLRRIVKKNIGPRRIPSRISGKCSFLVEGNADADRQKSNHTRFFSTKTNEWKRKEEQLQVAPLSKVYVAVGSNLGDKFGNIDKAVSLLCDPSFDANHKVQDHPKQPTKRTGEKNNTTAQRQPFAVRLVRTSMLHESSPMYVTDQPSFMNGVIEIETNLLPQQVLKRLKNVEETLGRNLHNGIRNGPRTVDLDIILYQQQLSAPNDWLIMNDTSPDLIIPHPRMAEREFVLKPLFEVAGKDLCHPVLKETIGALLLKLYKSFHSSLEREEKQQEGSIVAIIPLPRGRRILFNETIIMGILNVTPDSFCDGGKWNQSYNDATDHAIQMEKDGAHIIDIGGESTRPGATPVTIEEELKRTIPIIERIRKVSDIPISIDTRNAAVAKAAIEAGADIVNDISGGQHDPNMLSTVAALKVPIVLMHMRGTPETMQNMTHYEEGVVDSVAKKLQRISTQAEEAGIPKWFQILDPGIGFAKNLSGNLHLLKNIQTLREKVTSSQTVPILIGTSRKGFIGTVSNTTQAEDRDSGTIASYITATCLDRGVVGKQFGENYIVRVHNVKASKQACMVMDAIKNA